jgi:hypothetical protein
LLTGIEDASEYWRSVGTITNALAPSRNVPSAIADFSGFVEHLFELRVKLDPQNPDDVVVYLLASSQIEDVLFLIWKFSDYLCTPYLFFNSLNILLSMRKPVRGRIAQVPGSLDFIFDHYFRLLETSPIETNADAAVARTNLCQVLCKLLSDYPEKILRFARFHGRMWLRLLRLMTKSSVTVAIAAFRTATQQANWMLRLVQANPAPSLLHRPSIRFAMAVRPPEFGLVALCNTLIQQGIVDQCDIGMTSRML